jgi:glycosyltransferase involved in cell wall biosynthesis
MRHGGGADLAAWGQARELAKYHNVSVVCDSDTKTSTGELITSRDIPFHRYPVKPRNLPTVAREVGKLGFDLISTHTAPMDVISCLSGTPHILHDYGLPDINITLKYESLKYWGVVNSCRLFSSRHQATKAVFPSSSYIAHDLKWFTKHEKPTYILHSGIEFPNVDEVKTFSMDAPYILFVGRHVRYKGVDHLIRLFGQVRKRLPGVHLVTVGLQYDPFYTKVLNQCAERVGNVHMYGYVDDVWPIIKGATVYATCSLYEGEDRPALEAQSMGVPVVSFDNYSHPEIVKNGYCAVGDTDFVEALCHFLTTDSKNMDAARLVRKEYSLSAVGERYNKLIKQVI